MRDLTVAETDMVSGGGNVEICQVGTAVVGSLIGGVIGSYGTLGFGAGIGASWGFSLGSAAGTLWCGKFFE